MIVDIPTEQDIRFVLDHMRELDRREFTAAGAELELLPMRIQMGSAFHFAAYDDFGVPQAVWGMMMSRRGVGIGFAFGTRNWGKALPAIARNIKRFVLPFILQQGYHRVECLALAHRKDVKRFLELVGAMPEAVHRQWGAGGEDFVSYRWLADEYRAAKNQALDRHLAH